MGFSVSSAGRTYRPEFECDPPPAIIVALVANVKGGTDVHCYLGDGFIEHVVGLPPAARKQLVADICRTVIKTLLQRFQVKTWYPFERFL